MEHSSRANLKGDDQYIMIAVLTQVEIPFFSFGSRFKKMSKQMVSSTITVLFDSSSHQMSGLRSVKGRWVGSK